MKLLRKISSFCKKLEKKGNQFIEKYPYVCSILLFIAMLIAMVTGFSFAWQQNIMGIVVMGFLVAGFGAMQLLTIVKTQTNNDDDNNNDDDDIPPDGGLPPYEKIIKAAEDYITNRYYANTR